MKHMMNQLTKKNYCGEAGQNIDSFYDVTCDACMAMFNRWRRHLERYNR